MSKPPYTVKINGPGLSFDRPIDEAIANNIINLVMNGVSAPITGATIMTAPAAVTPSGVSAPLQPGADATPKQFIMLKRPQTNYERIACLAFYLVNHRSTLEFKSNELAKLNQEAAQQPIPSMRVVVNDATRKYHFLASAGAGKKQISPLGEAIVSALPDREKVKAALTDYKPQKKRRASKKRKAAKTRL